MRRFRTILILPMVAALCLFFGTGAMAMGSRPKPLDYNLLIITIDTLRADHLGCYGYRMVKTPVIDRLVSEGVLFTQAFTPAPITLPSHTSIMTGLYPAQHGVRNNGNFYLSPQVLTLAEVMRGNGYKTGACVGAFVLDSIFGLDQGFDFYDDNFTPGKKRTNVLFNERNAGQVTRIGLRWLERHRGDKFLLWLHYYDPHSPYFPPYPFTFEYRDHLYDGEIAYVDQCLGELFKGMEEMGLTGKTVIILTADHGEGLGDHNELTHGVFIYDITLHIPLIVKVPGLQEGGRSIAAQVSNMDVMPTVIDLFGFKPLKGLAGKSLIPLIRGKDVQIHPRLFCESLCPELNFGWSALEGIRTPEWKYIQAPVSELYDLGRDAGEMNNLLAQAPEDHAAWKIVLDQLKQEYPSVVKVQPQATMDPETEQRLRSLGYVWTRPQTSAEEEKPKPDPKDKIHIMNYLDDGMGYLLIGLYDKAIEAFQKVVDLDQDNIAGYFNLACAYESIDDLKQAEALFKKVLTMDQTHLDVHNHLGVIYYQRGEWEKAENEFQAALELVEYSEVYYNLSLVYSKTGDLKAAIASIQKAIELDPDYADALNHLGNLYLEGNDLQKAAAQFKIVLEVDPSHVTAHNNLGLIYVKWGMNAEALALFEEAVRLDPNSAEANNNLGSLYIGHGKHDQALLLLKKALELRPDYVKAMINLGMLYMSMNERVNAEQLFKRAIETDANSVEAFSHLGYMYLQDQEFNDAIDAFQRMVAIAPADPRAHYNLGKAYHAIGNTAEAMKEWQRTLELEPGLAGAHLNLGNLYFDMGDFQRAQQEWKQAFVGRPVDVPTHLVNLGMVYFQSEQYKMAIHAWLKASELRPDDPAIHYNCAIAYFKQGLYDDADLALKECLRIQPDFQGSRQLQEKIRLQKR